MRKKCQCRCGCYRATSKNEIEKFQSVIYYDFWWAFNDIESHESEKLSFYFSLACSFRIVILSIYFFCTKDGRIEHFSSKMQRNPLVPVVHLFIIYWCQSLVQKKNLSKDISEILLQNIFAFQFTVVSSHAHILANTKTVFRKWQTIKLKDELFPFKPKIFNLNTIVSIWTTFKIFLLAFDKNKIKWKVN